MSPAFWSQVDRFARNLLPGALCFALAMLSMVPVRIQGYTEIAPMWTVMGVCYWSIARPDLLRPHMAFAIGVFEDVLVGDPLGINALVLLIVHGLLAVQQRFFFGKPFFVWWWALGLVAAMASLVKWVLFAIVEEVWVMPQMVFVGYVATVALYPALGWVFARVEMALAREG
ncbi:MAG: rod shape-determining protein MreD [Alphaproteobacteria bacterium]|nr:rod shape-determining protein MreD [Alphaproteobacteria bacterium]MBF0129770.1 rod shape-determining protein MreD [Alphaproteobacteria bacterium]